MPFVIFYFIFEIEPLVFYENTMMRWTRINNVPQVSLQINQNETDTLWSSDLPFVPSE